MSVSPFPAANKRHLAMNKEPLEGYLATGTQTLS